jgi:broad specificity phosphatase PhoE
LLDSQPLYLVRHGETTWNRAERMQGQQDTPLTPLGVAQASGAGRVLRALLGTGQEAARFVTSPLGRARRSAEIILAHLPDQVDAATEDDRLKEIRWGDFEGLTRQAIGAVSLRLWRSPADRWRVPPPGGESYLMLSERVSPLLAELRRSPRPAVIIAHGGVRRALRGLYLDLPPEQIPMLDEPHDVIFRLQAGTMATFQIEVTE